MSEIDHKKLSITDALSVIGELEHLRRHILRSVQYMDDNDNKIFWLVEADKCQQLRRKYTAKYFPVDEKYWCMVKSCGTLRQLLYETTSGDLDELKDIDLLVDEVMSEITGQNLSGCEMCRQDRPDTSEES